MALAVLSFLAHFTFASLLAGTEQVYGENPGFITILFESISALATVGLSTAGKFVVILAMIIGRLSPLTIVYALQTDQVKKRYRLPKTNVSIG